MSHSNRSIDNEPTFGSTTAARHLGVSKTCIIINAKLGRIPHTRDRSGRRRFTLAALEAFQKARLRRQRVLLQDFYDTSADSDEPEQPAGARPVKKKQPNATC